MFAKFLRHLRRDHSIVRTDRPAVFLVNCKSRRMSSEGKDNEGSANVQQGAPGNKITEGKPETESESTLTLSEGKSDDSFRSYTDATEEDVRRSDLKNKALSFLPTVVETALNPHQVAIHKAHVQALKAGEMFYKDPVTGYQVMTRLAHLHRGNCCGNACRHCPFGQKSAPEELKKAYNSAFYE